MALFKLLTISLMDEIVPFLQAQSVLITAQQLGQAVRGFRWDGGAHILKLPPTKNLRAMLGDWVET